MVYARRSRPNVNPTISGASHFWIPTSRDDREEETRVRALPQVRSYHSSAPTLYHSTPPAERTFVTVALGLGAVSAGAFAASQMVQAFNEFQASRPEPTEVPPEEENMAKTEEDQQKAQQETKTEEKKKEGKRENIFSKWFDVGGKYYEGGFEDTMTRREAALILGVRESSSAKRIKEAHRKLLVLNHPDTGGSTYLAGKLNEAKELLMKGK